MICVMKQRWEDKRAAQEYVSSRTRHAIMLVCGLIFGAAFSEARMIVAIYYMHKLGVTLTICRGWWGGL